MEISPEYKNESQEKLAVIATGLARHIEILQACIDRKNAEDEEYQAALIALTELSKEVAKPSVETTVKKRAAQTGHGPTEQGELAVVETTYSLDEADQICPTCGGELEEWDGQFETSEEVDVIQRQFVVREIKRKKYRCTCADCGHIDTAIGPVKSIIGGRYSLRFGLEVAIQKYLDHIPLERMCRSMKRQGLRVRSSTLWDQIDALAFHLQASYDAIREYILTGKVVGLDTTGWPRLHKKGRGSKPWQMWCLTKQDAVYHAICEDKSAATCLDILGDFTGVVVSDQASTHHKAARDGPGFQIAGCWAHVYRKFREAAEDFPADAMIVQQLIGEIYDLERDADRPIAEIRDTKSRVVMQELFDVLCNIKALPKSSLGRAVNYTLKAWPTLKLFLDDENIWLDNNLTERSLRGPVVGRKNHYGSKSVRGTEVAAILYSLTETAKLVGVNPRTYLHEAARRAILNPGKATLPHELL